MNFTDYLKYLIIIISTFLLLFLIYKIFSTNSSQKTSLTRLEMDKLRKIKTGEVKFDVKNGNISLFIALNSDIFIIPYVKDLFGRGKRIDKFIKIRYPYQMEDVGNEVIKALELCDNGVPVNMGAVIKKAGYKSWNLFSKNLKSISIQYKNGTGFIMHATKNLKNGNFILINNKECKKVISGASSIGEIGLEIIQLKRVCK